MSKKHRRCGFTLIETALVISLEILVVGMAVSLLMLVSDVRIREKQTEAARLALPRLADAFRQDVQTAEEINLDRQTLTLTQPDGQICMYSIQNEAEDGPKCLFTQQKDEQIIARENYALPKHAVAWFQQGEGEFAGIIALSVWTAPTNPKESLPDGQLLHEKMDTSGLNPFTRQDGTLDGVIDPRNMGNWLTVLQKQSH